jgi:predicted dienelactone hydrolase
MFLLSDHSGAKDPADLQIAVDIKSVFARMPPESRTALSIQGANHFSFSDQMLLRNQAVVSIVQRAMGLTLASRRGLEIAAETIHRFLDVHLKGAPASSIHALLREYPELKPEPR